ncbi:hypothetical protein [Priestia megaterium]|uniref:hypothetical protein n=1 Tax=Priestia megaterium TaxID=1404 RepID=UPI0014940BC5|nr:hypothetical protein [Priestia megaterium]
MQGDAIFILLRILILCLYIVPIVLIIWYAIKLLKLQQEKVKILRAISQKLDKFNNKI